MARRASRFRLALTAMLILPIAACSGLRGGDGEDGTPLRQVAFFGGEVVAAAPAGYCFDPRS